MTGLNLTMTCLDCGKPFTVGRKRTHKCDDCRNKDWNSYQADRRKQIREGVWPALHSRLPEEVSVNLATFVDEFVAAERFQPAVVDRQPSGYLTPAGSDEGRSTFFKDLAADLDYACKQVAKHTWWIENPHWSYQIDNPLAAKKIKGE